MTPEERAVLERYVQAIIIPIKNTDVIKYPIKQGRVNHLFLEEYAEEFIRDFYELKAKGYSDKDIGQLFGNHSRLTRMLHLILKGAKLGNYSKENRQTLTLDIIKIIQSQKSRDIFNENKSNLVLNPEEVNAIVTQNKFESAGKTANLIQKLCGVLWAYSEAPFFVAHDIGMEEHGLYAYKSKKILVRDFFNLKPAELWPECQNFPYNKIQIACIYSKRFKIGFDVCGNTYPNSGNTVQDLEKFYIKADDQYLATGKIPELIEKSITIINSISKKADSMNEKEIAKKYADIYWFRKKPLSDALQKNWMPPKHIYEKIDSGEILPEKTKNPSKDEIIKDLDLL